MKRLQAFGGLLAVLSGFSAAPSYAQQEIVFTKSLIGGCILTLDTDGTLGLTSDGLELNSELGNGTSAVMAVVAIGTIPTITFSAPDLDAPAEDSGSQAFIKYTSLSGADQPYTQSQSSYKGGLLVDAYTVDGRIVNNSGFASGDYSLSTTATCEQ